MFVPIDLPQDTCDRLNDYLDGETPSDPESMIRATLVEELGLSARQADFVIRQLPAFRHHVLFEFYPSHETPTLEERQRRAFLTFLETHRFPAVRFDEWLEDQKKA